MAVTALAGGLGFLSRVPVGRHDEAWEAFRRTPWAFPACGYVIGIVLAIPFLVPIPELTIAVGFLVWLFLVTGITHLDGLADFADGLVVHGDVDRRRTVMRDTTVGVGGVTAVAIAVVALLSAAVLVAGGPIRLVGVVIAAEVSAKLAMVLAIALGEPSHDGMGAAFVTETAPRAAIAPILVALPAAALTFPHPAAGVALLAGILGGAAVVRTADRHFGGVSGDVLGASNEIARLAGLHAGVLAWTLW